MAYLTQNDLAGRVPAATLQEALADSRQDPSVGESVWDAIVSDVGRQIDSRLGGRFSVPLSAPLPAVVQDAAVVLAAELVFARRGMPADQNPWNTQAKAVRERLERIGRGDEPLSTTKPAASSPAIVISESARTHSAAGNLMA